MVTKTSAACTNCQTSFANLPVDHDEDGASYAVLELTPCAECGTLLCPCCSTFHCDGCGETFCSEHAVIVEDGTDRPLQCCAACAQECEPMELVPAIACVSCHGAVTMAHSQTSDCFGTWHTSCWNEEHERAAVLMAELDEAEGFTLRPVIAPKPMGAADATVQPQVSEVA